MSDAKHGRYVTKQVNLAAGKPHVQILFQKVKYWTLHFLQQPNFLQAKFADLWVVKCTIIASQLVLQQHVFVARFTVPLRFMKLKTFLKAVDWNLNSHEAIKKLQAKPIGIHLANSIQEDAGSSNIRLVRVLILLRLFWWIMLIVVSIKGAVYYYCKCYDCLPVCRLRSCGGITRGHRAQERMWNEICISSDVLLEVEVELRRWNFPTSTSLSLIAGSQLRGRNQWCGWERDCYV